MKTVIRNSSGCTQTAFLCRTAAPHPAFHQLSGLTLMEGSAQQQQQLWMCVSQAQDSPPQLTCCILRRSSRSNFAALRVGPLASDQQDSSAAWLMTNTQSKMNIPFMA